MTEVNPAEERIRQILIERAKRTDPRVPRKAPNHLPRPVYRRRSGSGLLEMAALPRHRHRPRTRQHLRA